MADKRSTLSPEQLEKLKVAREKALGVRQSNAKNKALEKELAKAEKEQHINTVKEKLVKIKAGTSAGKQEAPKIEIVESEHDEDDTEVIIKKTKTKPKKKKIVIVEDSDSDEEQQQIIYVKKKKDTQNKDVNDVKIKEEQPAPETVATLISNQVFAKPPPQQQPQNDDKFQRHYNAIFGGRRQF
jgi:hypothetical protein